MRDIINSIATRLKNDSSISAIVGDRVYGRWIDRSTKTPCITLFPIWADYDNEVPRFEFLLQLDIWGGTIDQVESLVRAVVTNLSSAVFETEHHYVKLVRLSRVEIIDIRSKRATFDIDITGFRKY